MKDNAYKKAGVDTHAGAELINRIKPNVSKTKRSGVMSGLGGFGALFDLKETGYKDPILVSATDGVGTKIKIAIELDRHDTIGIDAVAMCVNDLVVQGAEPLFFLDYFATGKLVGDVAASVIASIAEGCEQAGCALVGGETAEMPGLYMAGDYDIAGFTVGAVERERLITGERVREGDIILGLSSNGIHSNGYSLVRKLVKENPAYTYETKCPFEPSLSLGEMLLMPTRIYVKAILEALKVNDAQGQNAIHAMAHITGGGPIENIPRSVPDGLQARLQGGSWPMPAVFNWMKDIGSLTHNDMIETFNCGLGMIVICDKDHAKDIAQTLTSADESVHVIGEIIKGDEKVTIDTPEKMWS